MFSMAMAFLLGLAAQLLVAGQVAARLQSILGLGRLLEKKVQTTTKEKVSTTTKEKIPTTKDSGQEKVPTTKEKLPTTKFEKKVPTTKFKEKVPTFGATTMRVCRAHFLQRCQSCYEPIMKGMTLGKTSAGWCHVECALAAKPPQ